MRAYTHLRRDIMTTLVSCEVMGFLAFSAALTLAILQLTAMQEPPGHRDVDQEREHWLLVESMALDLREYSATMECGIAASGAELLEVLLATKSGLYHGPEVYDAVIPYFGRAKFHIKPGADMSSSTTVGSAFDSVESTDVSAVGEWSMDSGFGAQF
ncbi:hypothetical protein B0T19DRAFT_111317 [Cercophora scortea]|uniref:Uncharacterized protein n=1 Tax=Cercophora scortea TaxID=314031 RepID=A0AAE0IWY7_9PEZI|nr:hypothetical protein B0T19DRAFT_111317 [Cercophora scortea]